MVRPKGLAQSPVTIARISAAASARHAADDPPGVRTCLRCGECKSIEAFAWFKNSLGKMYQRRTCDACQDLLGYWYKYGLSQSDIETMLASQDGLCAICKRNPPVALDHDHKSGRHRSFLCMGRNTLVGWAEHPLRSVVDAYLSQHNEERS